MIAKQLILIVDDDENDLKLTLAAVRREDGNSEIAIVRDGAQALDYLHCRGEFHARTRRNPCLVLLDLHMPLLSGLEVLRAVKSDASLRSIPVVIFSSSPRERDVSECYQSGANAYLVKSLDIAQFNDAMRDLVSFWLKRNLPPSQRTAPVLQAGPPRSCVHADYGQHPN